MKVKLAGALFSAAFLAATSFAAVAAESQAQVKAPVQLSDAQMAKVVAGAVANRGELQRCAGNPRC